MKRLIQWVVFVIGTLTLLSTPAHSGGVVHAMKPFSVSLPNATQIYYPPFDPSMTDILLHGDPAYHYPELNLDLTADMLKLDVVRFKITATVASSIVAGHLTSEDPFNFWYNLDIDWLQPNPDYSFEMGANTIIFHGIGPTGGFPVNRNFQISFELNEMTDMTGVVMANLQGFDIPKSTTVKTRRSNFLLKDDNQLHLTAHYVWPSHHFLDGYSEPPGAQIVLLPPVWSGVVEMVYHFSLDYDAIDHAVLFDNFSDPDLSWNVDSTGIIELIEYNDDYAVKMTTGSTASMSRQIDTPDMPVLLMFNCALLTDTGTLQVSLDEEVVLMIGPGDIVQDMITPQRLLIADRRILGRNDSLLTFTLHGPSGSMALIDNIGVYAVKEHDGPPSGNENVGDGGGGTCFIKTLL